MTTKQIELANQMHTSGISWSIIATYFKTTEDKLRLHRKNYEQATPTTTE